MTSEFVLVDETGTVDDAITALRGLDENFESVRYVYTKNEEGRLAGAVSLNDLIVHGGQTVLSDIAESELVVASPDDDQEDVAKDIAKYNLLAMPVVDDARKLLGIVTVDDALDVMEEEHEEYLQIAGAASRDGDGSRGGHDLVWLLRNELWFAFWMLGLAALALVAGTNGASDTTLLHALALPVAVIAANDSISYVTNFFLGYDPDDEDAPSLLGFTIKGLGLGLLFSALVLLVAGGIKAALFASGLGAYDPSFHGFASAAVSVMASFLCAPAYLTILRVRDAKNLETSGLALQATAMAVAIVVYAVALACLPGGLGA